MAEKSIPAELRVEPPPQVHGLISPSDEVDLLTPQLKSFVQKVVDDMADKIIAGLAPKQEASESVKRECWEVCRAVGGRCFVDGCMEEATELDHAVSGRHVSAEDMVPMCRGHNGQFGVPGSAQRSPDGKIAHERWLHHLRHYRKRQRLV